MWKHNPWCRAGQNWERCQWLWQFLTERNSASLKIEVVRQNRKSWRQAGGCSRFLFEIIRWRKITISIQPFYFLRLRRSQESSWKSLAFPLNTPFHGKIRIMCNINYCLFFSQCIDVLLALAVCKVTHRPDTLPNGKCYLLPVSKFFFSFSRVLKHSSSSLLALGDSCLWQGRKGSIPKVTRLCQKWEQAEADIQQPQQSISDSQGLLANSLDTLCRNLPSV